MDARKLIPYLIAAGALALAALIRYAFDPWLGDHYSVTLFFASTAIAVWVGGWRPALAVALVGYWIANVFFLTPRGYFSVVGAERAFGLIGYLFSCGIIIGIGEALRRTRERAVFGHQRLEQALNAARMVAWEYDVALRKLEATENMRELLEVGGAQSVEEALRNIHPEDKARHDRAMAKAIRGGREYFAVYRYVRPSDRRVMWIEDHGEVQRDSAGRALKVRGIAIDVTEKVLLEQQLTRQAKALAEAGRRKSEFIATLAHELRTPLSALRAIAAVLEHPEGNSVSRGPSLKMLRRQVSTMQGLVDDLMDVSRIEQGKLALHTQTVDVAQVVEAAIEDNVPSIEIKEQTLSVHFPPRPVWVTVDERRISQAVGNLIGNASKFTPRRGHLTVLTDEHEGMARISIRDDGIGIAPEKIGRVFDLFMQGDAAHSSHGLGLGLALVKSLVELHGGHVKASSSGLGQGSEFTVLLQLASQREQFPATRQQQE